MVRNKVVAAMTGAALVVALFGGTASADDVPSNAPVERHNMSIICSFQGGTLFPAVVLGVVVLGGHGR